MSTGNIIEISCVNPYGTEFVLAVNPIGGENGEPFFMFGSEFDVYDKVYGPAVDRCGSYEEVRNQLEFEAGFDDDFADVAVGFVYDLDDWMRNN